MKRRLLLIIVTVFVSISLIACGNETNNSNSETDNSEVADSKSTTNNSDKDETASTSGAGVNGDLPEGGTSIIPINSDSVEHMTPVDTVGGDDEMIALQPCYDPLFVQSNEGIRYYLAESLEPIEDDGMHYQMNQVTREYDAEAKVCSSILYY